MVECMEYFKDLDDRFAKIVDNMDYWPKVTAKDIVGVQPMADIKTATEIQWKSEHAKNVMGENFRKFQENIVKYIESLDLGEGEPSFTFEVLKNRDGSGTIMFKEEEFLTKEDVEIK